MKTRQIFIGLLALGLLLLLALTVGLSQAQGPEPEEKPVGAKPTVTWPSTTPEPTVAAPSVGGAGEPAAAAGSSGTAPDGAIKSQGPAEQPAGAENGDVRALQGSASLRIAGSALRPRASDVDWQASGQGGCIYATSGNVGTWWNTPVYLPQGATVKWLRMYYYDANASVDFWGYFTVYDLYGNVVSDWGVHSDGSPGNDWDTTAEFTHTVDYDNYSYVVNWRPWDTGSDIQLCGFRIFYDPPAGMTYLPVVTKNYP